MSGHTPGPWKIVWSYPTHFGPGSFSCQATCGKGQIPRSVRRLGPKEPRANMSWTEAHEMNPGSVEQIVYAAGVICDSVVAPNPEDAYLIASAPDLLEACKALLESGRTASETLEEWPDACRMARAAIAKAEGFDV